MSTSSTQAARQAWIDALNLFACAAKPIAAAALAGGGTVNDGEATFYEQALERLTVAEIAYLGEPQN